MAQKCFHAAWRYGRAGVCALVAAYFFFIPGFLILGDVRDPAISGAGIPRVAWRTYRHLAPIYADWARERIASGKAAHLQLHDVPSTEWPLFGSVYFLLATEALQEAWERDPSFAPEAPKIYARAAIDAALDLLLDPVHHSWVKTHWGANYLHTENVFFRSLLIAGITSHARLTGSQEHLALLRDQVDSLARELDASPHGLLNDYPNECYPIDVFAATYLIRKADGVLKTDHSAFVQRELRAFQGRMLDDFGLVSYTSDPASGVILQPSRGICNSYICIFAPELYPEQAGVWYAQHEKYFWQNHFSAEGFREFRRDRPDSEWTFDVDSGPVLAGFSPAANAYGVAAARANGRFDHAFTLTTQVLGACWPLADGTLLGPRMLSSLTHAPYLGEANLLFLLTRQPAPGVKLVTGGHRPLFFHFQLLFFFGFGACILWSGIAVVWREKISTSRWPRMKFSAWLVLTLLGAAAVLAGHVGLGLLVLLIAQFLPRRSACRKSKVVPLAPAAKT